MSGPQRIVPTGDESRPMDPCPFDRARRRTAARGRTGPAISARGRWHAIGLGAVCITAFECSQVMYLAPVGTLGSDTRALFAHAAVGAPSAAPHDAPDAPPNAPLPLS
jgi:hypothetical protein